MPMMPFSGVRISWLAIARKRDLARLAASAWSRASASARSLSVRSVTSRPMLCISAGCPASYRTSPSRQAIHRAPSGPAILWSWIAGAVRFQRGVALFENGERGGAADQHVARLLRQFAIGVVDEGDAAFRYRAVRSNRPATRTGGGRAARLPAIPSFDPPSLHCARRSCAASCASAGIRKLRVASATQAIANRKLTPTAKDCGS